MARDFGVLQLKSCTFSAKITKSKKDRLKGIDVKPKQLMGANQLEHSLAQKELGVPVDTKLNTNQKDDSAVKKVDGAFSCIK